MHVDQIISSMSLFNVAAGGAWETKAIALVHTTMFLLWTRRPLGSEPVFGEATAEVCPAEMQDCIQHPSACAVHQYHAQYIRHVLAQTEL